ncbi:MAG: arginine--tRNA ligase [Candidatus Gastranaerophilaceae bacterium]
MLKQECLKIIDSGLKKAIKNNECGELNQIPDFRVEIPKNRDFGDFAINVSALCRYTKKSPLDTAKIIVKNIDDVNIIGEDEAELSSFTIKIIGGFINFKVKKDALVNAMNLVVKEILSSKTEYGKNNIGNGEKVIIEYVSANPTGPFHIGHGRWAALGSALANIMKFSGYDVFQEFYVNDAGNQINNLGRSLYIRVLQQMGINAEFPSEDTKAKSYYTGDYLIDCAKSFIKDNYELAEKIASENREEADEQTHKILCLYAKNNMLGKQKALLESFGTHFDNFYFETSLHERGDVQKCLDELKAKDMLYEKEGALWFRSSKYGDDEDRVIKKTDGAYTYLTADIAYHYDKLKRGFTKLINIWGADHHGYIPRMRAAIESLGYNPDKLIVLLGQLVNLTNNGEQVRMGKRTKMITLDDLVNEVGVDATRFWMIMRDIDNTLEFDVDLAKSKTDENPLFYVQYAHARACSVIRNTVSEREDSVNKTTLPALFSQDELNNYFENITDKNLNTLWTNEKEAEEIKKLVEKLFEYKSVVIQSAKNYMPYLITKYLKELAAVFHKFYSSTRILSDDKNTSKAKIAIVQAVIYVLKSGLTLIGTHAPEKM